MADANLAIWVITPNGLRLAKQIVRTRHMVDVFMSENLETDAGNDNAFRFSHLAEAVARHFRQYSGHLFIMATGIVVRLLASQLRNKMEDPAVMVMDDAGNHVISLLSGHVGGANRLTREVSALIGAKPIITTATDVNARPAIDVIAVEQGLRIDNPAAIRVINMALLTGKPVSIYDPYNQLTHRLSDSLVIRITSKPSENQGPCVCVDDVNEFAGTQTLVLRPQTLAVGIGRNRHTSKEELIGFLWQVMDKHQLSRNSISTLASIEVKSDEAGLLEMSGDLRIPLVFYSRHDLNAIENVANPSQMVQKHVGVESVCEAAAILAADHGQLIVPKQKSPNVTVAIARKPYLS